MPTKILFLAAKVQPFLVSGIHELYAQFDVSVLLYCAKEPNNDLYEMPENSSFQQIEYDGQPQPKFIKTIKDFNPDIVFCSGWMFSSYVNWCAILCKQGAKTICAMDTQWKGTLKQKLNILVAPFYLQKSFSHAWVPGQRQFEYASRLGFLSQNILYLLYAPNTDIFAKAYQNFKQNKVANFPKKLLYVGRLEEHKLKNFLIAFHRLNSHQLGDWRLTVVGEGEMQPHDLLQHSSIDNFPFLPQNKLTDIVAEGAVFCLCSSDEPWGTVVQEFAAGGMPLLISKQCGSSDFFVRENGILCDGINIESIFNSLLRMINKSDAQLFEMAEKSHQLGVSSNSADWAKELMSIE